MKELTFWYYSEHEIKDAFWKTFHQIGEVFFDYLSSKEENNSSTELVWNEFKENLDECKTEEE